MSHLKNHPPVPLTEENVTPEWMGEILGVKMSAQNFEKEMNVQAGTGFLSSMIRLRCRAEDESKAFNLIVKLLPESEMMLGIILSEGFDKTEIGFYQKIVPDLLLILPELDKYLCTSYYGHFQIKDESKDTPHASALILEDLKPQGYYTITFADKETPEQIKDCLTFMAKFHCAGMVLEEKQEGVKLLQVYDFLQGIQKLGDNPMFYELAMGGFPVINQILQDHGVERSVMDAYQKLAPYSQSIIEQIDAAGRELPCLIHGDLWTNNMLFHDNPEKHTKIIDWQWLGYKDACFDLAINLVSSIPIEDLNRNVVEMYLKHYYTTFVTQCEEIGYPKLVTRDWEQFSKFFFTWGMAYAFLWFHLCVTTDTFGSNIKRLVQIYEFLAVEVNVPEFLLSQVE